MIGHDGHTQQRDDALRARLAGIDPARSGGPAFAADPTPDDIQERIMATTDQPTTTLDDQPAPAGDTGRPASRTRWLAAAAALVLVATGVAGALAVRDARRTVSDYPSLALTVPGGDGAVSSSCIPFDVQFLRDMPVAFAGTVASVTAEQVTLSVDRWYHGTAAQQRADVVTLAVPGDPTSAALDGVRFVQGNRYLLAATDGTVNGCGFSGPADPQLEAAYDEAFGG